MERNFKMFSTTVCVVLFSMMFVLFSAETTYAQTNIIKIVKVIRDKARPYIKPDKAKELPNSILEREKRDYVKSKIVGKEFDCFETLADKALDGAGGTVACVAGSSGSAIMATVSGTSYLPAAAGYGAAYKLNKHVFNGNSKGDKAARVGTYVGATAGTAVSAGAVATYGAGTTGLATVGGFVGGGMAAGATAIVAAPVAAAVTVGFLCKWLFD